MTKALVQNFRGARALIIHPPDDNRDRLVSVLHRLGLLVCALDAGETETAIAGALGSCDVLFFDADEGMGPILDGVTLPDVPLVALIGVEAPSRLSRVVRARAAGHIAKPIRSTGVFTALFLAFNEFAVRQRRAEERRALEERVRARRFVTKAILKMMAAQGVDDEEAYRQLRRESMRRRMTVEALCEQVLSTEGCMPQEDSHAGPPAPPVQSVKHKMNT